MATWTSDNLPATTTWFNLRTFGEIPNTLPFKDAENVTMGSLTFFNPTASDAALRTAAGSLAAQLDAEDRNFWGARFKQGVSRASAISALTDVLVQKTNTLSTLADKTDELYNF